MTVTLVLVGIGVVAAAAVGAAARWGMAEVANRRFPYGTLAVNVVAAVALGALTGLGGDAWWHPVVAIGFLGALSTWSTVATEVAQLARDGHGSAALLYLLATVTMGILAAWTGLQLTG